MRTFTVVAAGLLVSLVAGCAPGGDPVASPSVSASPSPAPSPSPAASPSSPSPSAIPSSVPASAFLQAADAEKGQAPNPVDPAVGTPSFCGATFASYRDIGIRRSANLLWSHQASPEGSTPAGVVTETITVYRGGGATQFMTDLQKAVAGCPSHKIGSLTHKYRVIGSGSGDSILVEDSTPAYAEDGSPLSGRRYVFWAAVRSGDSVALVKNEGWESSSADQGESKAFAGKAAKRLAAWRG